DAPLAEGVRAVTPPPAGTSRFFWAAAEHATFRALLAQARRDGWDKTERLIVSYWRRGVAGEEDGVLRSALRALTG
ncbi:SIP domain-containing protein, partial [Methylopila musalis]